MRAHARTHTLGLRAVLVGWASAERGPIKCAANVKTPVTASTSIKASSATGHSVALNFNSIQFARLQKGTWGRYKGHWENIWKMYFKKKKKRDTSLK